jgi:hypothetical protein
LCEGICVALRLFKFENGGVSTHGGFKSVDFLGEGSGHEISLDCFGEQGRDLLEVCFVAIGQYKVCFIND